MCVLWWEVGVPLATESLNETGRKVSAAKSGGDEKNIVTIDLSSFLCPRCPMRLAIKHGAGATPITLDVPDGADGVATVAALTAAVEAATGVLARSQKLLARGRVLAPPTAPLSAFTGVIDGATLMLLATGGGAPPTAGAAAATARLAARRAADAAAGTAATAPTASLATRARGWAATGVVSLRGAGLIELPVEAVVATATAVDVGGNSLPSLPAALATAMPGVTRLRADHNQLTCVDALPGGLTALNLAFNPALARVPPCVSACVGLVTLNLASCGLTDLPPSLGALTRLTELSVADNTLKGLPEALFEGCGVLASLDARRNAITSLPACLGRPRGGAALSLVALQLDANKIAALPAGMLAACTRLCDLSLSANPLTAATLAADPGFPAYDARRIATANLRLGARVGVDGAFRGAADEEVWAKHAGGK